MLSRLERFSLVANKISPDLYAMFLLLIGSGLTIHGLKDEGQLVIGAALAVFKGHSASS